MNVKGRSRRRDGGNPCPCGIRGTLKSGEAARYEGDQDLYINGLAKGACSEMKRSYLLDAFPGETSLRRTARGVAVFMGGIGWLQIQVQRGEGGGQVMSGARTGAMRMSDG